MEPLERGAWGEKLRARYYDSATNCEDPERDGANWYSYCGADPVNRTDPTGTSWLGDLWNEVKKTVNKIGNKIGNFIKQASEINAYNQKMMQAAKHQACPADG